VLALSALWLALASPSPVLAQDMGSDHDAGDEEMLTGQPMTGSRPGQRPGASAAPELPPAELSYSTRLDKTAVWVGDQFHYQIIVDHSPKIQFVLENLNPENINMEPLRVMGAASQSYALKNGNSRLFVDLTLANFSTGIPQLQIPQLTLFYFRTEGAATSSPDAEGRAAESLTIDGPMIGVRSTLPPQPEDLRDAVTVTGWGDNRWVVAGVGWLALIVLVIGVGWEGAHMIRYRRGRTGPDPRKAMAAIQERWSRAIPGDFSDSSAVMDFYGQSYQDVKEFLGYALETHTEGLTADDMKEELGRLAANSDLTERASRVLATCESARYGRNGTGLNADTARGIEHDVREIFEAGKRLH
jgi:hypothetical protein